MRIVVALVLMVGLVVALIHKAKNVKLINIIKFAAPLILQNAATDKIIIQ